MNNLKAWNHRWFGVWKENGAAYSKCPSVLDFVCENNPDYDIEKIVQYLTTAQVVATTSRRAFPCVITGTTFSGSLSYRTDGVWFWPDDLAYYVREHRLIYDWAWNNYDNCKGNLEKEAAKKTLIARKMELSLVHPECWS